MLVLSPAIRWPAWVKSGLWRREAAMIRTLASSFSRVVILSEGADERTEPVGIDGVPMVVLDPTRSDSFDRLISILRPECGVVVRTHEFDAGSLAIEWRSKLLAAGHPVFLVARGASPWSRAVVSDHGPDSVEARQAGDQEGKLVGAADLVIAGTDAMASDLAWRYALEAQSVQVIPQSVCEDLPFKSSDDRSRYGILSIGPLLNRWRHDMLVEAIGMLPDTYRDTMSITILGEGPERQHLLDLAAAQHVKLTIEPMPAYDQVVDQLAQCGVYCQPAATEGIPVWLLDAMGTGAPVLITEAVNAGRVVEHGFSGLRLPPEAAALCRAIEGLSDDGAWRDALGNAAMNNVRDRYDPVKLAKAELAAWDAAGARRSSRQSSSRAKARPGHRAA